MTPKEIGRKAGRLFGATVPPNWALRSQEDQEDYGIDYEVELTTAEDQATGFIFKLQQKGVEKLSLNAAGDTVSFSDLSVNKVRYYLEQLAVPTILVVVGVEAEAVYWTALQGNPQVEKAYREAVAGGQKTLTIHLPINNSLPSTSGELLKGVANAYDWILARGLKSLSSRRLLAASMSQTDFEEVASALNRHHDLFRSERIENLIRSGSYQQAYTENANIFDSDSESVEIRFAAGMNLVRVQSALISHQESSGHGEELLRLRLLVAYRLLHLTRPRKTQNHLRLYARFLARSARLNALAQRDLGLSMSHRVQESFGDEFTRFITNNIKQRISISAVRELDRTLNVIRRIVARGYMDILTHAWAQLVLDVLPMLQRFRSEKFDEAAESLTSWLDGVGDLAVDISRHYKNWPDLIYCAIRRVMLANPKDPHAVKARLQSSRSIIESIEAAEEKKNGLESISRYEEFINQSVLTPALEDEIEMYRTMAIGLGINLDDADDPIADVVRTGLRDYNPERVLKNCQHLFVSVGLYGIPAQMLGLPSAGSKFIHCTKYGRSVMGSSLDNIYDTFKADFCSKCDSCIPHADNWKWSREWQEEQTEKHKDLAARAIGLFDLHAVDGIHEVEE